MALIEDKVQTSWGIINIVRCDVCGSDGFKMERPHFCKVAFHNTMQSIAVSLEKIANPPMKVEKTPRSMK